jgi:hypothetical protein
MGNARWGTNRRPPPEPQAAKPRPLELGSGPVPEDHQASIAQAQLNRITHPSSVYGTELVRWNRQFSTYDTPTLKQVVDEMTPKVVSLGGQTRNPPQWFTLDNWTDVAKAYDRAQAMLDAATRTLARRG